MTVPSLKRLSTAAVVLGLQNTLDNAYDVLRNKVVKLPDELIRTIVGHIFEDIENRVEALQYITCHSVSIVKITQFSNVNAKRVLELILKAFPKLVTLKCSSPYIDSAILQEVFSIKIAQEGQKSSAFPLDHSTEIQKRLSEECVQTITSLKLKNISLSETNITTLNCIPKTITQLDVSLCKQLLASEFSKERKPAHMLLRLIDYIACYVFAVAKPVVPIEHFNNLIKLNASNTKITSLEYVPDSVEDLRLSSCTEIPDFEFTHLARFKNLRKLDVSNTQISCFDSISVWVKVLKISSCRRISDSEISHLTRFKNLTKLCVSNTKIMSLESIPEQVKDLSITMCREMQESEFANLKRFQNLTKLSAARTQITRLDCIPESVNYLFLFQCKKILASEFIYLARLKNLNFLDISYTNIARLDCIPESVEYLFLSSCIEIPDSEFAHLARLKNLKRLDVSHTQITRLDTIPESVEDLLINDCPKLSEIEIAKFRQRSKD